MEKYVLLRGKVIGKWYDFDKRAHYHIIVEVKTEGIKREYDVSINIGSITYNDNDEIYSSDLQVYYEDNYHYNEKILKEMLLQKEGITKGRKNLNLDYVRMKLFPHEKMKPMKGLDREDTFLTGIIERHVLSAFDNDDFEIFVFGRLYDNEKGIHDVHMNQGSIDRYRKGDAPYSDGGLFFHERKTGKWIAIFIAFTTQSMNTDKKGRAIKKLPEIVKRILI